MNPYLKLISSLKNAVDVVPKLLPATDKVSSFLGSTRGAAQGKLRQLAEDSVASLHFSKGYRSTPLLTPQQLNSIVSSSPVHSAKKVAETVAKPVKPLSSNLLEKITEKISDAQYDERGLAESLKGLSFGVKPPKNIPVGKNDRPVYVAPQGGSPIGHVIFNNTEGVFEKINTHNLLSKLKIAPEKYGSGVYGVHALTDGRIAVGVPHVSGSLLDAQKLQPTELKNIGQELAKKLYFEWKTYGNYNTDIHLGNIIIGSNGKVVTIDPQFHPQRPVDLAKLRPFQVEERENLQSIYTNQGLSKFVAALAERHPQLKLINELMDQGKIST
jgi:hypothetical protein